LSAVEKRTVSLPDDQARYTDERDAAVEHWLGDTVAPVYDAMQADR
jgi:hypothetical protein